MELIYRHAESKSCGIGSFHPDFRRWLGKLGRMVPRGQCMKLWKWSQRWKGYQEVEKARKMKHLRKSTSSKQSYPLKRPGHLQPAMPPGCAPQPLWNSHLISTTWIWCKTLMGFSIFPCEFWSYVGPIPFYSLISPLRMEYLPCAITCLQHLTFLLILQRLTVKSFLESQRRL